MKILVIGGSGWMGTDFVQQAIQKGHHITVVSRGRLPVPEGAAHIRVDREDEGAWMDVVMNGLEFDDGGEGMRIDERFDYIIDFMGQGQKHAVQMLAIDGWGQPNLFVSSDLIYSPRQSGYPLCETSSRYQTRFFGGRKYQMEWMFTSGSSRRFTNVIRPGYLYSADYIPAVLPPYFGRNLLDVFSEERAIELPAGGFFLFQPLFLSDFTGTLLDLVEKPHHKGMKWNITGPELIDVRCFYDAIAAHLDISPEYIEKPLSGYLETDERNAQYCRNRYLDLSALRNSGLMIPDTAFGDVFPDNSHRYRTGR